jgi:hypothetical protein
VDTVTGDRGQALVLAVLALALAATTIVGLEAAQDRILADAHERRAGEAAVEAAGATLADALVERDRSDPAVLVSDPIVLERARAAADDLSAANGGGPVRDLRISAGPQGLDISLAMGSHRQRASIGTTCCRP